MSAPVASTAVSRRQFLAVSLAAGAAACSLVFLSQGNARATPAPQPNGFRGIRPLESGSRDDPAHAQLRQASYTAQARIVAEELRKSR